MQITKNIAEQVVVSYTVTKDDWIYMDMFTFTKQEYRDLTEAQLEAMITEKFNTWYAYVNPIVNPIQ
jgi:hypothetical protein